MHMNSRSLVHLHKKSTTKTVQGLGSPAKPFPAQIGVYWHTVGSQIDYPDEPTVFKKI